MTIFTLTKRYGLVGTVGQARAFTMPVRLEGSCRCGAVRFIGFAGAATLPALLLLDLPQDGGRRWIRHQLSRPSRTRSRYTGARRLASTAPRSGSPTRTAFAGCRPAPGSAISAPAVRALFGCSTRPGPSCFTPSLRRSTASCRSSSRVHLMLGSSRAGSCPGSGRMTSASTNNLAVDRGLAQKPRLVVE